MTIQKGLICCGLLLFFVFVYGNTMLMTISIAWNMTALNTSPILIATVSIYSL